MQLVNRVPTSFSLLGVESTKSNPRNCPTPLTPCKKPVSIFRYRLRECILLWLRHSLWAFKAPLTIIRFSPQDVAQKPDRKHVCASFLLQTACVDETQRILLPKTLLDKPLCFEISIKRWSPWKVNSMVWNSRCLRVKKWMVALYIVPLTRRKMRKSSRGRSPAIHSRISGLQPGSGTN